MAKRTKSAASAGARELTVGAEIREVRKARGLTLKEVSERTGRSVAYLSKIERGDARIAVDLLSEIGAALNVDPKWFFPSRSGEGPLEYSHVVRSNARRPFSNLYTRKFNELGFEDELLSSSLVGQFYMVLSKFPAGVRASDKDRKLYAFEGEQHGFVIEGSICLTLGEESINLAAGDSFSFPSEIPHRIENNGDRDAVVIWGMAPIRISW